MGDDDQLGCFPKSSGRSGPPPDNLQSYIRRRMPAEMTAAFDERSRPEERSSPDLPPFPPVPQGIGARLGKHGQTTAATHYGGQFWKHGQTTASQSSRYFASACSVVDSVCGLFLLNDP